MSRLRERQFLVEKDGSFHYVKVPSPPVVEQPEKINYIVFALIVVFSVSSWIDMVGVFAELPLMVPVLPEGWNLSIYFCLAMEIPFIAPTIIYILVLVKPSVVKYPVAIAIIIVTGGTSLALLSKFWSKTVLIAGKPKSIPLLSLVTTLGLVDSCSSVVFYPYMKRYHPMYTFAILVGESLTGFIPAFLKLIQGGAEPHCLNDANSSSNSLVEFYTEPKFSVSVYFMILAIIMFFCFVAFALLEKHPRLYAVQLSYRKSSIQSTNEKRKLTKWEYGHHMAIMAGSAFVLWGLVSAFNTYSMLPFGFRVTNNAIITVNGIRFSAVVLAYKYPTENITVINSITLALMVPSTYMLICAVYSPCPPLVNTFRGAILTAACMISVDYFATYMRSCVIKRISFQGGNAMVTCAMVNKSGVMLGAVMSTILVNKTDLFRARQFCAPLKEQCLGYRSRFLPNE